MGRSANLFNSNSKAVIWQSPPTALKDESGSTNYEDATAISINSNGEIVGVIRIGVVSKPYYWSSSTANGKPLSLNDGADEYESGVALSINSKGENCWLCFCFPSIIINLLIGSSSGRSECKNTTCANRC